MKKPERTAEEWKALCILLLVACLLLGYGWYRTENNRLKQIESLHEQIEELEARIDDLS